MISHTEFIKIKELKELGLSQRQIGKHLNISRGNVERWWHLSEAEFFVAERNDRGSLENYREYIISVLKLCPQINATNVYYKLKEKFEDFDPKRSTFHRYLKSLREQLGFEKKRFTAARESLPPGQEAQVDFGQYKMISMYGNYVRVYFFTMVLSYSNMRFVYFSPDSFTTEMAIKAHEYAYRYFGGRTKVNMYDLDKVFVVSENAGNLMFTKEFEDYAKEVGFGIITCRPRDPQTKGRVENLVGYIKQGFLEGRTYEGVDSLNRAALNWLDREGNERQLSISNFTPRELFVEESAHLIQVKPRSLIQKTIYAVTSKTTIVYVQNEYVLPKGKVNAGDKVRIEVYGDTLIIYSLTNNEFICKHKLQDGIGKVSTYDEPARPTTKDEEIMRLFDNNPDVAIFLKRLKEKDSRYYLAKCARINKIQKHHSVDSILNAIRHCVNSRIYNINELLAFLIYKHGGEKIKKHTNKILYLACNKRAKELEEEYHGKHK